MIKNKETMTREKKDDGHARATWDKRGEMRDLDLKKKEQDDD